MMVQFQGLVTPTRFEDSGLEPLIAGKFLLGVMKRGQLSSNEVSAKTGIPAEQLAGVLESQTPIDRKLSKKLNRAFPKLGPLLLKLQRDRDFFDRYGAVRPASPLRRANLVRSAQQTIS